MQGKQLTPATLDEVFLDPYLLFKNNHHNLMAMKQQDHN